MTNKDFNIIKKYIDDIRAKKQDITEIIDTDNKVYDDYRNRKCESYTLSKFEVKTNIGIAHLGDGNIIIEPDGDGAITHIWIQNTLPQLRVRSQYRYEGNGTFTLYPDCDYNNYFKEIKSSTYVGKVFTDTYISTNLNVISFNFNELTTLLAGIPDVIDTIKEKMYEHLNNQK